MKSNIASGIAGIAVSGSNDDKMFKMMLKTDGKLEDWIRNITTFSNLGTTWLTKSFYIDTMNASTDGKANDLTDYTPTTDEDVNSGINIMLYNYSTGASTVYIKDIKIEKYNSVP